MANTKTSLATDLDTPGKAVSNHDMLGRLKVGFRARIVLASQASGDTVELGDLVPGFKPVMGVIETDTSLGTATLAIGVSGTAGKYRAAATFTTVDQPVLFGVAAAMNAALAAKERLIATVGTAALPASGNVDIVVLGTIGD